MKSCLGELNGTFMVMRIGRYPQIAVNAGDIVSGGACPFPGWDGKASFNLSQVDILKNAADVPCPG